MFSGIGGFELGIQRAYDFHIGEAAARGQRAATDSAGAEGTKPPPLLCVGYSEIDKYATKVYERHFNHENYGDATKLVTRPGTGQIPNFELLVGGFPCQSFSVAGKRKGFNETRGTLFFDIARVLSDRRPAHFLLENVKGLLIDDSGRTFQTILRVLTDMGYDIEWQVINSAAFGVPQFRQRVFIVGHLGRRCRSKIFPITQSRGVATRSLDEARAKAIHARTITATSLPGRPDTEQTHVVTRPMQWRRSEEGKSERQRRKAQGHDYTPFSSQHRELVPRNSDIVNTITSQSISKDSLLSVNTRPPKGLSAGRIRRLTPKECERLQAFPDDWTMEGLEPFTDQKGRLGQQRVNISDTQRYKMTGNAVTVNVIQAIMEKFFKHEEALI